MHCESLLFVLPIPIKDPVNGVFNSFNPENEWHQYVRTLSIDILDKSDDLLMNFIDFDADTTDIQADFNSRFDMANHFKNKMRKPRFLQHFNEVPTFVRSRVGGSRKRVFLGELEQKVKTTKGNDFSIFLRLIRYKRK